MPKNINKTVAKKAAKNLRKTRLPRKFSLSFFSQLLSFIKHFAKLSLRTKALFVFGFLFLGISLTWHLNQTIQLAFFTPKVIPVEKKFPIPTQLSIPAVNIHLPIEETAINNGIWQVSQKGASHLTISARPGENGTIIMYGHNTTERLGPIRWLNKGQKIELISADDKIHVYTITNLLTVSPDKMDIFTTQKDETLIIYTCDGFADLQRFIIIAKKTNK